MKLLLACFFCHVMFNFKMLISRSLWVWSHPSAASLATAKTSFLKIDGLKAACSCSPFGLLQHLCMWLNWYEKGSTSTSNIDVGLKPGDFYVVTVSHWWIAVEAQGLSCTCVLPRVFQFINPGVSRFIQCRCKSEFSQLRLSHAHLFFCKFLFFFSHWAQEIQSLTLASSAHVGQGGDLQSL